MQLLQGLRKAAERAAGSGLDGAEGNVQEIGDLGLRQPAPVGELEQCSLVLGQVLQRPVNAPGQPGVLGFLGWARLGGSLFGKLHRRLERARARSPRRRSASAKTGRTKRR